MTIPLEEPCGEARNTLNPKPHEANLSQGCMCRPRKNQNSVFARMRGRVELLGPTLQTALGFGVYQNRGPSGRMYGDYTDRCGALLRAPQNWFRKIPIWVVVKNYGPFLDPYHNTAPNI